MQLDMELISGYLEKAENIIDNFSTRTCMG